MDNVDAMTYVSSSDRLGEYFHTKMDRLKDEASEIDTPRCQLGQLVHIRGRIKTFFNEPKVMIYSLREFYLGKSLIFKTVIFVVCSSFIVLQKLL